MTSAAEDVRAGTNKKLLLMLVIFAQVAVPAVALAHRIATGAMSIPWGWQMYS